MSEGKNTFEVLNSINVNEHVKKKSGLSYLSWAWAWAEFKKAMPDATYRVKKWTCSGSTDGADIQMDMPYLFDPNLGYMVFTEVTAGGETHEMWLFVMDGANKAMKDTPYCYKVKEWVNGKFTGKYIDKEVQAATMFDINTTIQRCLVKNYAMFGLGLYIYAGEDIPDQSEVVAEVKRDEDFLRFKAAVTKKLGSYPADLIRSVFKEHKFETKAKKADTMIKALVDQVKDKPTLTIIGENIKVAHEKADPEAAKAVEAKKKADAKIKAAADKKKKAEAEKSEAAEKKEEAKEEPPATEAEEATQEPASDLIVPSGGSGEAVVASQAKFDDPDDATDETIIRSGYADFILSNFQCKIESTITLLMLEEYVTDEVEDWTRVHTSTLMKLYGQLNKDETTLAEVLPGFYV